MSRMGTRVLNLQREQFGFMFTLKDTGEPYVRPAPIGKISPNGPADRAGLTLNDGIIAVNGRSIRNKTHIEVSNMIRASSGRYIELLVTTELDKPIEFEDKFTSRNNYRATGRRRTSDLSISSVQSQWTANRDSPSSFMSTNPEYSSRDLPSNSYTARITRKEAYHLGSYSASDLQDCSPEKNSFTPLGRMSLNQLTTQPKLRLRPSRCSEINSSNSRLHRVAENSSAVLKSNDDINQAYGSQLSMSSGKWDQLGASSPHLTPQAHSSPTFITDSATGARIRLNRVGGLVLAPLSTDEIAEDSDLASSPSPSPSLLPPATSGTKRSPTPSRTDHMGGLAKQSARSPRPLPLRMQHQMQTATSDNALRSQVAHGHHSTTLSPPGQIVEDQSQSYSNRLSTGSPNSVFSMDQVSPRAGSTVPLICSTNPIVLSNQESRARFLSNQSLDNWSPVSLSNSTNHIDISQEPRLEASYASQSSATSGSANDSFIPRGVPLSRVGMVNLRAYAGSSQDRGFSPDPAMRVSQKEREKQQRNPRPMVYIDKEENRSPRSSSDQEQFANCFRCNQPDNQCHCKHRYQQQQSYYHAVNHGTVNISSSHSSNAPPASDTTTEKESADRTDGACYSKSTEQDLDQKNRNFKKLKNFFGENSKNKLKAVDSDRHIKTPRISEAIKNPLTPVSSQVMTKISMIDGKTIKSHWKQMNLSIDQDHVVITRDKNVYTSASVDDTPHSCLPINSCRIDEDFLEKNRSRRKFTVRISYGNEFDATLQFSDSESMEYWVDQLAAPNQMCGLVSEDRNLRNLPPHNHKPNLSGLLTDDELKSSGRMTKNLNIIKNITNYQKYKKKTANLAASIFPSTSASHSDFERQKEEWFSAQNRFMTPQQFDDSSSNPRNFGVSLSKYPRSSCSPLIPFIIELCVQLVENFGINCVGIYRVCGNKLSMNALTEQITKDLEFIDTEHPAWGDIHAVGGVLRAFLRSLPDPLFPKSMYPNFIAACKTYSKDQARRLQSIQRYLAEMACYRGDDFIEVRCQRETLRYLAGHLCRVASLVDENKMDFHNLAVIFAPNLIHTHSEDPQTSMFDSQYRIQLMEDIIRHHQWIFSSEPPPSWNASFNNGSVSSMVSSEALTSQMSAQSDTKSEEDYSQSQAASDSSHKNEMKGESLNANQLVCKLVQSAIECQETSANSPTEEETSMAFSELSRLVQLEKEDEESFQSSKEIDIDQAVHMAKKLNKSGDSDQQRLGISTASSSSLNNFKQRSFECLATYETDLEQLTQKASANRKDFEETQRLRLMAEQQLKDVQNQLDAEKIELNSLTDCDSPLNNSFSRSRGDPIGNPIRRPKRNTNNATAVAAAVSQSPSVAIPPEKVGGDDAGFSCLNEADQSSAHKSRVRRRHTWNHAAARVASAAMKGDECTEANKENKRDIPHFRSTDALNLELQTNNFKSPANPLQRKQR